MKWTAVSHATGTVLIGAGIVVSGQLLTRALFGIAVVCFVIGIVIARRSGGMNPETDLPK
ncbi:hypothetical protein [Natrarchaeobaculum sulfurireducens]|uniref:Uncharacterized protein n=1 Tax=Natrarchaeobaculum sulfurireducens TaxID=2044521 RepID=A0A346PU98_9EURY|nr:hypothetical protein [Natrarchaeobaculum sulfurireducens]AXR83093.1 hypothetical protein AArcMg_3106 [Natrarchaeobaculum sulfurireducens]